MKWIAISGSCRLWNKKVEKDVRHIVKKILENGDSIVTGGATGVDYIATEEVMKYNLNLDRIKIFIPGSFELYIKHYQNGGEVYDGISHEEGLKLVIQLKKIKKINSNVIEQVGNSLIITQKEYDQRDQKTIMLANELYAFRVNNSYGTSNTIKMAQEKGLKVQVIDYNIEK